MIVKYKHTQFQTNSIKLKNTFHKYYRKNEGVH